LFYPANFWYHKNHIKLLKALKLLKERFGLEIQLVLSGSKNNGFKDMLQEMKRLKIENQVKYLGYVTDEDLLGLYKLATALIMPTFFESVSMPIWEAFYLGCPVVSSNVCALPEQVSDAGLLFDPNNVEEMAKSIYRIWTDEGLRQALIQKGSDKIRNFTLRNYAQQWEEVIGEVLQEQKRKQID